MADQIDVKIAAQIGEFVDAMKASTAALQQMADHSKGQAKEIESGFQHMAESVRDSFKDLIGGIGIAELIAKTREMVLRQLEFADALDQASHKVAMSTDSLQTLKFAGDLVGVSFEGITRGMRGLTMAMSQAEGGNAQIIQAFNDVGVSVNDLKNIQPEELFLRIADAFHKNADGAGKMETALMLARRGGMEMIPLWNLGRQGLEELAQAARDLGIVIDKDQVEAMSRAGTELKLLHAQSEAMQRQFSAALVPTIEKVVIAFGSLNDKSAQTVTAAELVGRVLLGFTAIVGVVWTAVMDLGAALGALGAIVVNIVSNFDAKYLLAGPAGAVAGLVVAISKSKTDIGSTWGELKDQFAANNRGLVDLFDQLGSAGDVAANKLSRLAARVQELQHPGSDNALGRDNTTQRRAAEIEHQIRIRELQGARDKELAAQDLATHQINEAAKADADMQANAATARDVRALYQQLADLYLNDTKQREAALNKLREYDLKVANEHTRDVTTALKAEEEAGKKKADIRAKELDEDIRLMREGQKLESDYLQQMVDEHKITAADKLAVELKIENDIYAANRATLEAKLQGYREESNEYRAILREIGVLDSDHSSRLQKNATEAAKQVAAVWEPAVNHITGLWDQMLTGVLQGTQTWSQAFNRAGLDMVVSFAVNVSKMMLQWLAFKAGLVLADPFGPNGINLGGLAVGGLGGNAAAMGTSAADATKKLAETMSENTDATVANSGGILQSVQSTMRDVAQALGLTTATASSTTATAANTATQATATTTVTGAMAALVVALNANTVAVSANSGASGLGGLGGLGGFSGLSMFTSEAGVAEMGDFVIEAAPAVMAAATGAWNLQKDTMLVAHAGEMILPKDQAELVRAGRAGGGGAFPSGGTSGGGAGGGGGSPIVFQVHAVDGASVANLFKNQGEQLAAILARSVRNNSMGLKAGGKSAVFQ